jgi:hypothetical protein
MLEQDKDKVAMPEWQAKFDQVKSQNLRINRAEDPFLQALSDKLSTDAASSFVGEVVSAGRESNGKFFVNYIAGGAGYYSFWPQWAFDLAKSALLYGKRLGVVSNGAPYGENLLYVDILS